MTREEIENIPKNINTLLSLSVTMHTRQKLDEKLNKVCELAIKTLEQEPKTGYWYIDERPESDREVICSNCKQPVFKYHKMDFDYRPKFCPNCGAKMSEIPTGSESVGCGMSKSVLIVDTPKTCGDCPLCIYTAEEKKYAGYCNTSNDDYYCKALDRFMEYDKVDGGVDILGKPIDCPLQTESEGEDGKRGMICF